MAKHVRNEDRPGPVFIAGCGRSGTTYLRTLLDGHPDLFLPTESLFLVDYLKAEGTVPARILKPLFFREPQLRAWYSGEAFEIDRIPDAIDRVHRGAMRASGATVWGQKTPRFVRHMDTFSAAFPGIRWILMYRDPRGVVSSMLKSARHSSSVGRAIDRWLADNRPVIEELREGGVTPNILLVRFEELIERPDATMKRILEFLGVRDLSLRELAERGEVTTPRGSRFSQASVRSGLGPDRSIIHSWQGQLSNEQVRLVEWRCREYMELMGYEPVTSGQPGRVFRALDRLRQVRDIAIPFRYLWYWPSYLFHFVLRKLILGIFRLRRHP